MNGRTVVRLARVRGGNKALYQQQAMPEPSLPFPSATNTAPAYPSSSSPSSSGPLSQHPPLPSLTLEQIRQKLKQQQHQRRPFVLEEGPTNSKGRNYAAAPSASPAVAEDRLLSYVISSTRSAPKIALPSAIGQDTRNKKTQQFSSPYLAREAAKEEAQRSLGQTYRQKKAVESFDEIFPALGSGLMGADPENSTRKGDLDLLDKRKYMEMMASLCPSAPSPHLIKQKKQGQGSDARAATTTTIPQQRSAIVGALAEKMKTLWSELVKKGLEDAGTRALSPMEREAVLAGALESLVSTLSDEEVLIAAKTGLIDVDALSTELSPTVTSHYAAKGVSIGNSSDGEDSAVSRPSSTLYESSPPPTIAAAVLPADLLHSLSHAATISEWLADASAFTLSGEVDDEIATLLIRAKDPSKFGSFTEEEIQKLEAFEASRRRGMGLDDSTNISKAIEQQKRKRALLLPDENNKKNSSKGASSVADEDGEANALKAKHNETASHVPFSTTSVATNPLIGTNPLLHKIAAMSPALSESLHVMDRTRMSALSDVEFQQALAYTNALYQREYARQCDRAEMRPLDSEEVRVLERNAGKRLHISSTRAQLDMASAKAASGQGVDGIGAADATKATRRQLRQRYGNSQRMHHAFNMAKAMRVLNPTASLRPNTATDIPLFFDPNRSVPPAAAGMNMPLPSVLKKGKKMVRGLEKNTKHFSE